MASNGNCSVYIPTINNMYTEYSIKQLFGINNLGDVIRVDFAPFQDTNNNKKEGFCQAFVHFRPFEGSQAVFDMIERRGSYKFYPHKKHQTFAINTSNEYWILLKNNAPVPETTQNIHQLAHNALLMEQKMEEKDLQIAELIKKVDTVMELNKMLLSIVETHQQNIEILSGRISLLNSESNKGKMTIDELI
jgi:hypothetical protein